MAERNPLRRRVLIILGNQAYVQAFVVDTAPEVAGPVVESRCATTSA